MIDHLTLRRARINMELSLEEAAEGICSVSLLSLIERGKRTLTPKVARALEERLAQGLEAANVATFSDEYLHAQAMLRNGDFEEVLALAVNFKNPLEATMATAFAQEELGQIDEAAKSLQQVVQSPDVQPHQLAPAAQGLVRIEKERGDFYSAIYWGEDAIRIIQQAGPNEHVDLYPLKATLSAIYLEVGDYPKALELVRSSAPDTSHGWDRVVSLWSEGSVLFKQGRYAQAVVFFREAYTLTLEHDRLMAQMRLLQTLVWLEAKADELNFAEGRKHLERAKAVFTEQGAVADLANLLNTYAVLEYKAGDYAEAETKARQSLELTRTLPEFTRTEILVDNAEVLQPLIEEEDLRALLSEALGILSKTKGDRLVATVWARLGKVYEALGDQQAAFTCYHASIEAAGILPSEVKAR